MLLLFALLLFGPVAAEWPPSSCSRNAVISENRVQLTSPSNEMSECSVAQFYEDEVYIRLARFYPNKNRNYRGVLDSKVVISVNDKMDETLFNVEVHSDRIQALNNRCFGVFQNAKPWELRLKVHTFYDLQKTVVSASTAKGGRDFKPCFQFELDKVVGQFKLNIRGSTQSGMEQWVHEISKDSPKGMDASNVDAKIQSLEKQMKTLRLTVLQLSERVVENNVQQDQHMQKVDSKHRELDKHLRTSISRNDQSVRHYSYMSWAMFVLLCIFGIVAVKFTQHYIRKRDKIF